MDSSSSTDELAGFRLLHELGRGPSAVVYEATQVSLNRRVAFKLFEPGTVDAQRLRRLYWPEHPAAVSLYAAGVCERGPFLAMQLVHGTTLAQLRRPRAVRELLAHVAAALDAAHDAGSVHGGVRARNVLIDREGRALLTDFGLGDEDASQRTDREAFAGLVHEYTGAAFSEPLPRSCAEIAAAASPTGNRNRAWPIAAVAVAAAVALGVATRGGDEAQRVPAPLPGAKVLGSALGASGVESVDCDGRPASAGSSPCTVVQTALAGRRAVPDRGGVIRRWAVRGAQGEMALQVLRARGLSYYMVARSPFVRIADSGVHVLPANLPVRAGDLVGLELTPGASIGTRAVAGASTARWLAPLEVSVRPPDARLGFDRELLLRTEYTAGAKYRPAGQLSGADAARAPAGQVLRRYGLRPGLTAVVSRVRGEVVVDSYRAGRRVQRLPVAGLDPSGQLVSLGITTVRFGAPILRLEWRNPGGVVARLWTARRRSLAPLG
jgi:hypothetical protein